MATVLPICGSGKCAELSNLSDLNKSHNEIRFDLMFSKDINEFEHLSGINLLDFPKDRLLETVIWFKDISILKICRTEQGVSSVIETLKKCPHDSFVMIISCLTEPKKYNENVFCSIVHWLGNSNIVSKCSDREMISNLVTLLNSINPSIFEFIRETFINNPNPLHDSVDGFQFYGRILKTIAYLQEQELSEVQWHNRLVTEACRPINKSYQVFFKNLSGKTFTIYMYHGMLTSDLKRKLQNGQIDIEETKFVLEGGLKIFWNDYMPKITDINFIRKEVMDFWILKIYFPIDLVRYIFSYYPLVKQEQRLDLLGLYHFHKFYGENYLEGKTIYALSGRRGD